jgi:small subunit ribosomal protein S17
MENEMDIENTKENELFEDVHGETIPETSAETVNTFEEVEALPEQVIPIIPETVQTAEIQPERGSNKRILTGKVTSNKPDKTIVVNIVRQVAHPLYKKYFKRSKKIMAHDENNVCGMGDLVKIRECRPLSKYKRFELLEVVERAK